MLEALKRARFIMESPLIASWVNGAGALDLVRQAIDSGSRCAEHPVTITLARGLSRWTRWTNFRRSASDRCVTVQLLITTRSAARWLEVV